MIVKTIDVCFEVTDLVPKDVLKNVLVFSVGTVLNITVVEVKLQIPVKNGSGSFRVVI